MFNSKWISRAALLIAACGSFSFAQQPRVAILSSDNARNYFLLHYPVCGGTNYLGYHEFDRYLQGWEHVLQQAGIPYAEITDSQVAGGAALSSYQVLILSNAPSLSEDETKAIQQWVIRGGRLLATFGSGYKDIISDPRQADGLKLQEGGAGGLHNLWHDPLSKVVTSAAVLNPPGVDVQITRFAGPTANLTGLTGSNGTVLPYGSLANMLVQRPANYPDAYGFFVIDPTQWKRPAPAILSGSMAHGAVVYFAFAPEYLVSLEFGLPSMCPGYTTDTWKGRSESGASLMRSAVNYLLGLSN